MGSKAILLVSAAVFLATAGCATRSTARGDGGTGIIDGSGGDGSRGDGSVIPNPGPNAIVTGRVWAPGNAPGMVPAGHEIPVFGAVVRLTSGMPEPIPSTAYCQRCVEVSGIHGIAAHDGSFSIAGITPGDYYLVVEKGQFRIQTPITLLAGETRAIEQELTTLPSIADPAAGRFVPRVAVASGNYDDLQDVLGKMQIGTVNASGTYEVAPGSESIDFYTNGGEEYGTPAGSLEDLVSNLDRMRQYHIIFIPCAADDNTSALQSQSNLRNIRDYVALGGKLYVTDWSGEWMDNVFPAQLTLQNDDGIGFGSENADTPASAYDAASNSWDTSLFGDADGDSYDSNNAEVVDDDLFAWLNGQMGPDAEDPTIIGTFDPSHFDVVDSWNTIEMTTPVQVGLDEEGLPLIDSPKAYVIGGHGTETPKLPLTVTFEPAGCGRVLYSTYHTTDTAHAGLVPQERILLYLIMEIGVCIEEPILI